MRRLLAVGAVLLMLAGCGRSPYDPSSAVESEPKKEIQVVQYQGRDLFCIQQAIAHGEDSYSCDFAAFYAEPEHHGSTFETARVTLVTMPYRGKMLYCFAYDGGHGTTGYTCDFERFYRENPPPLAAHG